MAHFCGFIKLIFLLLMLARIPANETKPLKGNSPVNSDLIAGNEFLKLFMEHDALDKDFNSGDLHIGSGGSGGSAGKNRRNAVVENLKAAAAAATATQKEPFDKKSAETGRRFSSGRSLNDKGPQLNQAEGQAENSKQVVKLVTSGSKIVFLEDYDENDAILDAEARDIDLKKEIFKEKNHTNFDDYKVVAVSVSSSSQRGTTTARNRFPTSASSVKYEKRPSATGSTTTTTSKPFMAITSKPKLSVSSPALSSTAASSSTKMENTAGDNFINRSHKSEFSIEEVEPLTMTQHQSRNSHSRHRKYPVTSVSDTLEALDSENSASNNIHNVLAAPLQSSASARSMSMVTTTYHSGQRNVTINHDSNMHVAQARHKTTTTTNTGNDDTKAGDLQQPQGDGVAVVEEQLLPFQTVIYHDTKAGHGPQSRSISYSSISQNVEDLKKWQQSGILAEARRNVSESLKPMQRSNTSSASSSSTNQPEPAKFYSQPSKMYSEPSKFYSEPAKVYSEPAKVYGEPEKFYSEPAKVYGQPSKFYSEPSKVYSQPAKVYSEPAKTYWPILTATTTSTQNPNTIIPSTLAPHTATKPPPTPPPVNIQESSRKPAIVSRIAFGEANLIPSTTSSTTSTTTANASLPTTSGAYGQHPYSRTYSSHRNPSAYSSSFSNQNSSVSGSSASSSATSAPSRRILFNLDRLPYDLLNAPEPSVQQQQLLELQKTRRPQQTLTYQTQRQEQPQQRQQQDQQQQQQQRHHINPCLESAVSSLFSSSTLTAHPELLKQQQQHSNQNAKGLADGDLVKCVAAIPHLSPAATATDDVSDNAREGVELFTTERNHLEELFPPTPEQNYEIEESVSVMTDGRTHNDGTQGDGGRNSFAQPTTSPAHQQQHHGFKPNRQRTRIHFGTNVNNPIEAHKDGGHHQQQNVRLSQMPYNTHTNANTDINSKQRHHQNAPYYQQYDDVNPNDNDDADNDSAVKNNDYDDGGGGGGDSPANGNNGDDDDSKVAYIVDGENYRKYRVEEETDDGFIVGEYGVVDHNDGNLRGVRYTADSTINRSLIQKALLTFLKLK